MKLAQALRRKRSWMALPIILLTLSCYLIARLWIDWIQPLSSKPLILCPLRLMTGLPCPLCGTTRALSALSHGQFKEAFLLNPLSCIVFTLTPLATVLFLIYLCLKKEKSFLHSTLWPKNAERYAIKIGLFLILANWIYLVWACIAAR